MSMRLVWRKFARIFTVKDSITRFFTIAMLSYTTCGVHGQSIGYAAQAPLFGSIIEKNRVEYFNPGESGADCLWDFSDTSASGEIIKVSNVTDSLGRIISTDNRQRTYYFIKGDSLFESGNETPLKATTYYKPPFCMKHPISFGDSISKEYEGYGIYCGNHYYMEKGVSSVVADGYGDIVLSEKDTLKNALRVYKLRAYSIAMDMDPTKIESTQNHQVIEEKYEWYVKGLEIPVLETVTSTSYANLTPIGTSNYAYCFLPELLSGNADSLQLGDKEHSEKDGQETEPLQDIIHYSISVVDNRVDISYSLDARANVTMLLCNHMGMIYHSVKYIQDAAAGYHVYFDIGGLRPGVYVLYINANGKIYNEKISK